MWRCILRYLTAGWTTERKEEYLRLLTEAKTWEGGSGYPLYLGNVARDMARQLTPEESARVLERGAEWPDAAFGALYKLPPQLSDEQRAALIRSISRLTRVSTRPADNSWLESWPCWPAAAIPIPWPISARSGIAIPNAASRSRWAWPKHRRATIGRISYAASRFWKTKRPAKYCSDWSRCRKSPEDPEQIRQVIVCGLRMKDEGADDAMALLEHWTGEQCGNDEDTWEPRLQAWQAWFAQAFPDLPPATLPTETADNKWKYRRAL